MADETNSETARYRIRRDAKGAFAWAENALTWGKAQWRDNRLFRWAATAVAVLIGLWLVVWFTLARNLPDAEMLLDYQPPLPTCRMMCPSNSFSK